MGIHSTHTLIFYYTYPGQTVAWYTFRFSYLCIYISFSKYFGGEREGDKYVLIIVFIYKLN